MHLMCYLVFNLQVGLNMFLRNYILFCLVIISIQNCYCQDVKYIHGSNKKYFHALNTVIDKSGKIIFQLKRGWISKYEIVNDSLNFIDSMKCVDDSF